MTKMVAFLQVIICLISLKGGQLPRLLEHTVVEPESNQNVTKKTTVYGTLAFPSIVFTFIAMANKEMAMGVPLPTLIKKGLRYYDLPSQK